MTLGLPDQATPDWGARRTAQRVILSVIVGPTGAITALAAGPSGVPDYCQAYTGAGLPELVLWLQQLFTPQAHVERLLVERGPWLTALDPVAVLGFSLLALPLRVLGITVQFIEPAAIEDVLPAMQAGWPDEPPGVQRALAQVRAWRNG